MRNRPIAFAAAWECLPASARQRYELRDRLAYVGGGACRASGEEVQTAG
jgi:hypothetical protein